MKLTDFWMFPDYIDINLTVNLRIFEDTDEQYEAWADQVFRDAGAAYLYRLPWMCESPDETDLSDTWVGVN